METNDQSAYQCDAPAKRKFKKKKPIDHTSEGKDDDDIGTVEGGAVFEGRSGTYSEYSALLQEMNILYENYKEAMYEIDGNVETASSDFDTFQDDVKKFRSKINSLLDSMEIKVLDIARKKKHEDTQAMIGLVSDMSAHKTELYSEISKIEDSVKNKSLTKVVHSMEDGKLKLDALQKHFNSLSRKINVRRVSFSLNESILDFLKSIDFGFVKEIETYKTKRVKYGRLDVSHSMEEKEIASMYQHTKEPGDIDLSCVKEEPIMIDDQSIKEEPNPDLQCIKEEPIENLSDNVQSFHSGLSTFASNSATVASAYPNIPPNEIIREDPISKRKDAVVLQGRPRTLKIQKLHSLYCKHKLDSAPYSITGSVMIDPYSDNDKDTILEDSIRMALADYNNSTLRIVEMPKDKNAFISHWVTLVSRPWDITCVGPTQLVVTVPDIESLVYVKIGPKLTVNKRIQVDGRCRGIDYANDVLIVTFVNPASVKILDMEAKVLKSIQTDATGLPLFKSPYYVKANNYAGSHAYITDWERHTVTKIDMNTGQMLDVFLSKELRRPYGIATDIFGRIFVCGWESNNICLVSAYHRTIRPVVRVPGPFSIVVCNESRKMFVSHSSTDSLDVFKMF